LTKQAAFRAIMSTTSSRQRHLRAASNDFSARRLAMEQLETRAMLAAFDVLVFHKTAGFQHGSIPEGIAAIQALGAANDFTVTATNNANQITAANLANYEVVVFLNTTGNVLDAAQQTAFEQYIQAGGGWVGVHSAADTEYDWAWYGELLGAYFQSHPAIQQAAIVVEDDSHPSTDDLPAQWTRTDEWYNFQTNPRSDVNVLLTLDESTYSGGADGPDHPIAWYHEYDGGRAWYTGLGHTDASYSEPLFLDHLLGGILYAAGQTPGEPSADFDADGAVDGSDFLRWQRGLGASGATRADGDANLDGLVDGQDLDVWSQSFGMAPLAPAASAVQLPALDAAFSSIDQTEFRESTRRRIDPQPFIESVVNRDADSVKAPVLLDALISSPNVVKRGRSTSEPADDVKQRLSLNFVATDLKSLIE
jgi:type 1 glutamine amidotransferase